MILVDSPIEGPDEFDPRARDVPFLGAQVTQEECIWVVLLQDVQISRTELFAMQLGQKRLDRFEFIRARAQAFEG